MLIGLVGVAGSGKDTVAKYMINYLRDAFKAAKFPKVYQTPEEYQYGGSLRYTAGFADKLKRVVAVMEGKDGIWDTQPKEFWRLYYSGHGKEEYLPGFGMTRREMLQKIGQGMRECIDENVWVTTVITPYLTAMNKWRDGQTLTREDDRPWVDIEPVCIIPDVRYENEINTIRNVGGHIYYINRPENPTFERMSPLEKSHSSVPAENKWNLPQIENQHDLGWLSRRSQELVRQLLMDSAAKSSKASRRLDSILT